MVSFNATFIAQIINFLIIVFLLAKFAYRPILNTLDERKKRIANDLESAEQDKIAAAKLKEQYEAQLSQARYEAQQILEKTQKLAEQTREEILAEARAEHERLLKAAQEQIARERQQAVNELRQEVVTLSMIAAAKIIGENLDEEKNAKLVSQFIDKLDADKIGGLPC